MCHIVMGSDPQVSNCRNQPQCTALEGRQQRGWRQERTVTGKNKTEKNHVVGAKGAGGFEASGSSVNHSRATKKNELRKGH